MSATGKTPILLYGSTTASNVPVAGNLTNSSDGCEIAINVADKNLFFKDSTNTVNTVPIRQSSASSNGWLSSTDWTTFNGKISSQWTTSGSNIYYTTGNVGFGTSSLFSNSLITAGNNTATPTGYSITALQNSGGVTPPTSAGLSIGWNYSNGGGENNIIFGTALGGSPRLAISSYNGTTVSEKMAVFASGGVSIGNTTDPGAGNFTINGATATKASGTTWANPSDIRLKENIQDFTKGLVELLQINPCTWEYNGKGGTTAGTKGIGVIADDVENILPESVDTYMARLDNEYEEPVKRFDATEITWLLVNAVKQLSYEISVLRGNK